METFLIHSLSHFCKLETGESDPIAYNMSFCITRRKVETHKRKLDSLSAVLAVSLQLLKSGYCCHLEAASPKNESRRCKKHWPTSHNKGSIHYKPNLNANYIDLQSDHPQKRFILDEVIWNLDMYNTYVCIVHIHYNTFVSLEQNILSCNQKYNVKTFEQTVDFYLVCKTCGVICSVCCDWLLTRK